MFHVELRQFPHNSCSFNLSEDELRPIVEPWVRELVFEFGERRWSPHEAKLIIIEGPELSLTELKMGRGWTAAQHSGEDVTERILVSARQAAQSAAAQAPGGVAQAPGAGVTGDPLGQAVQLAALLGPDAAGLLDAWREQAASSPGLTPSQTLALAEHSRAAPSPSSG